MLIRSQNKKVIAVLENCDSIGVYPVQSIYHICTYNGVEESRSSIGEYSTEEKAIRVLDMIQNSYQYCEECKYMGVGASQPEFAFQMPQDSEV